MPPKWQTSTNNTGKPLKIAVIGGGPAGLGAAIELAQLPLVKLCLYEQKPRIMETGGGISLHANAWRLLNNNGAAAHIGPDEFFKPPEGEIEQRRNGRTGDLLVRRGHQDKTSSVRDGQTCRLVRAKLQTALLKVVDQRHIRVLVGKKLRAVKDLPNSRVQISFEDGHVDDVDLLIGADGIRSVTRTTTFPDHTPTYNGQCVYRTIVSSQAAKAIPGMPWTAVFWKNESGRYVFTCPLGNDDFEVTVRILRPSGAEDPVSWGRSFNLNGLLLEFNDFCQPVRTILQLAAQGKTQEFALFAGPRLKHVISHRNTVLIGDAAHPFLGHFGSGAGFALEDTYVLGRVLEWAWQRDKPLSNALELFDSIRSPHYDNLYATADKVAVAKKRILAEGVSADDEIKRRVLAVSEASESWMYDYDIAEVTDEAIQQANLAIRLGEMSKEVATEQSTSQL